MSPCLTTECLKCCAPYVVCIAAAAAALYHGLRARAASKHAAAKAARKRDTVYLFSFPRPSGALGMSAPCLKVETFLRLCGIPYEIVFQMDPGASPSGRLPYMEYNGEELAESEFVIRRLVELLPDQCHVDAALTPKDVADKTALRRIVEVNMYFGKTRNAVVDNHEALAKFFSQFMPVPAFLAAPLMKYSFRASHIKMLNMQGYGDLTDAQYHAEFLTDIKAVETLVEAAPLEIPSVQAMVFAYLMTLREDCKMGIDAKCPALQHFKQSATLNKVVDEIEAKAFPDRAAILALSLPPSASYGSVLTKQ